MRQLASIQRVISVEPIPEADAIELIRVLGWELVAKKGEFKAGDLCVYCEVDSIMPERPEFEFLRAVKFRIKTRRMKGQISQGIAFPLTVMTGNYPKSYIGWNEETKDNCLVTFPPEDKAITYPLTEGTDVTDLLGVTKWEMPEEDTGLEVDGKPGRSRKKGVFPDWISKTDETRIQSVPGVLKDAIGTKCYFAEKLDGSSMTVFLKLDKDTGEYKFGVCSRNQEKAEIESCHFWSVARKQQMEERMRAILSDVDIAAMFPEGIALQGECVGPGIQKNKLKLKELDFYAFNVMNIAAGKMVDFEQYKMVCELYLGIKTCPILGELTIDENTTVQSLIALATRKSALCPEVWAEGLVFRPVVESYHRKLGRFSFKAINPEFLLKHGE